MNKRLLAYLRSLGLAADATNEQAWEFSRGLRGLQASVGNALNYAEGDDAARTNCDVMIRALGFDPENPNNLLPREEPQRTVATTTTTPGGDGASHAGDLERARAEGEQRAMQRLREIRELGEMTGCSEEFLRTLEGDLTVTIEQAREQIRADWRTRTTRNVDPDLPSAGPAIQSRNTQTDYSVDSLRCALMMQGGIDDPAQITRWFSRHGQLVTSPTQGDQLQRARDRGYELMGLGVREFVRRALALDGIRVEPTVAGISEAMQSRGAAAMSTTSLVNIFTQTFGARMLQAWTEAEDTTEGWVDTEENPNYMPNERVRAGLTEGLAHVARGAEAEDITLGDEHDYTKVFRYGRKAIFDEMDLVNDRFGVITSDVPRLMGSASRRLRPDLVYAILLANPTMADSVALFHATHGNTAAAAFSEAALEAAFTAMMIQRINGVTINVKPKYIVHPAAIALTVEKTIRPGTTVVVTGSTDAVRPNFNVIATKGLVNVGDARLDNGVIDPKTGTTYAGDANDWYLVADGPAPIVVSYLAGTRRAPRFRSGVLDQGQWGIWFDVQMSIGAKATEYRTIFRRTA